MPRILFSTIGSLGDLYPLLSVALALRERGAECVFAVHSDQVPVVEAAGFTAMSNSFSLEDFAAELGLSETEVIRKTFREPNFLFREILPYRLADVVRDIDGWAGEIDLVAATFQAEAARMVAELRGVPIVDLLLQPMMVFDPSQPPVIPGMPPMIPAPGRLGTAWNRVVLKSGLGSIRMMHGKRLNAARAALGMVPHNGVPWFEDAVPPALRLGLYAGLLHDHPPDMVPPVHPVGFCPYDGPDPGLDPELVAFLDGGPAPVVVTLGSNAEYLDTDIYAPTLAAIRSLGRRAVLLTGKGWTGDAGGRDAIQRDYVAHQLLFPRAAVVVHHGGIGTLSRALEAGVPQLVLPFGTDQPDNAARIVRLGLGATLAAKKVTRARVEAALAGVFGAPEIVSRTREVAAALGREDGAGEAAARILALV